MAIWFKRCLSHRRKLKYLDSSHFFLSLSLILNVVIYLTANALQIIATCYCNFKTPNFRVLKNLGCKNQKFDESLLRILLKIDHTLRRLSFQTLLPQKQHYNYRQGKVFDFAVYLAFLMLQNKFQGLPLSYENHHKTIHLRKGQIFPAVSNRDQAWNAGSQ